MVYFGKSPLDYWLGLYPKKEKNFNENYYQIQKAIEELSLTKKTKKDENENNLEDKLKNIFVPIYYKKRDMPWDDVFYAPSGITIERAPSSVLGFGVLGQAMPGLNLIHIREDLYGNDFEEVKKHEINHILFPYLTEGQIRDKTRLELPFSPRFH